MSASPLDLTRVTTLTFDCYGTLIDWEAGVIEVLRPLLARYGIAQSDDEIVATFQDIEAPLCEPALQVVSHGACRRGRALRAALRLPSRVR